MMLFDTNIVSELISQNPAAAVLDWAGRQEMDSCFISTITIAEMRYGIELLPAGRRRKSLEERLQAFIATSFEQRVLLFDEAAAQAYAQVRALRRRNGRPIAVLDAQIVAIAKAHGCGVATRNVRDFDGCGLKILNPFV